MYFFLKFGPLSGAPRASRSWWTLEHASSFWVNFKIRGVIPAA